MIESESSNDVPSNLLPKVKRQIDTNFFTKPIAVLQFGLEAGGISYRCCVTVQVDRAYLLGDGLEMVFYSGTGSGAQAIRHVERLGYKLADPSHASFVDG